MKIDDIRPGHARGAMHAVASFLSTRNREETAWIMMEGWPGVGKTMIARRIPQCIELTVFQANDARLIYRMCEMRLGDDLTDTVPFRAPHHTCSAAGLVGSFSPPRPGEISLAHGGVLFLDEVPEFPTSNLVRVGDIIGSGGRFDRGDWSWPARPAVVVGACNPCPCGFNGHPTRECRCSDKDRVRYRNRSTVLPWQRWFKL